MRYFVPFRQTSWNVYTSITTGLKMYVRADKDMTPIGRMAGFPFGKAQYRINVRPKGGIWIPGGPLGGAGTVNARQRSSILRPPTIMRHWC